MALYVAMNYFCFYSVVNLTVVLEILFFSFLKDLFIYHTMAYHVLCVYSFVIV